MNITRRADGDLRSGFADYAVGQDWVKAAPAIFVITGNFGSYAESTKFIYIEAGLAAENLLLQAVSLGLGGTYVGGFDVNKAEKFLNLSGGEEPIAVLPVGVGRTA